jgi:plasmid stabilization system protein ParE
MRKPVFTTPQADLQILEMDTWWRENRDKAPDLFEEELDLALALIAESPGIGKRYPSHRGVRRVLLRSTRNHVYYVEEEDRVLVLAVWGAVRASGPDLSGV